MPTSMADMNSPPFAFPLLYPFPYPLEFRGNAVGSAPFERDEDDGAAEGGRFLARIALLGRTSADAGLATPAPLPLCMEAADDGGGGGADSAPMVGGADERAPRGNEFNAPCCCCCCC